MHIHTHTFLCIHTHTHTHSTCAFTHHRGKPFLQLGLGTAAEKADLVLRLCCERTQHLRRKIGNLNVLKWQSVCMQCM